MKYLLPIILCVCLWSSLTLAEDKSQQPDANAALSQEDLEIIALMEILEDMNLMQEMDIVKDMDIIYEEAENENN